jgi:O-succinylbenzoate synthase
MVTRLYRYKNEREGLLLNYNDGWGEIAPLPGFSKESFQDALDETIELLPNLPAANPKLPSVRFGVSSALKPFPSKPIHLPLCALTPREGFTTLKLKLGSLSLERAIDLVKKHLNFRLRLDFNRMWTLDQALEFASHFKKTDFEYLEEPVNSFKDLVRFSEITEFPIGVDESLLTDPWQTVPSLKAAIVKPTLLGEIPPIPKGIDLILSSSMESGIGLISIARLATNNLAIGLDTYPFLKEDYLINPISCNFGYFSWIPSPVNTSKLCLITTE